MQLGVRNDEALQGDSVGIQVGFRLELRPPLGFAGQQFVEAEFVGHAEDSGDVTVRQRTLDLDRTGGAGQTGLAFEDAAKGVDPLPAGH